MPSAAVTGPMLSCGCVRLLLTFAQGVSNKNTVARKITVLAVLLLSFLSSSPSWRTVLHFLCSGFVCG